MLATSLESTTDFSDALVSRHTPAHAAPRGQAEAELEAELEVEAAAYAGRDGVRFR